MATTALPNSIQPVTDEQRIALSIVSPVYQSAESVVELVTRCIQEASQLTDDFEIILVDDRSPDNSWKRIEECCLRDARVKGVRLVRNVGQHRAITAGLQAARGAHVIMLDCDLQDDPAYFLQLYEKAAEGYDVVYARKTRRVHPRLRNWAAKVFYRGFNWLVGETSARAPSDIGAYSLLTRRVVDAYLQICDYHRHYLMVLRWLGFPSACIEVRQVARPYGRSSYTLPKLVLHAIDGIASQSQRLLYVSITIGLAFVVLAFAMISYVILSYFMIGALAGWSSTVSLILLSSGLILLSLGIHGIYIGRIFDEVRRRPLFLVDVDCNLTPEQRHKLRIPHGLPDVQRAPAHVRRDGA